MPIVRAREISTLAAYILMVLALVALAGCGSLGRLDPNPDHAVDLSGNWILDHAASDDPKPVLETLRPKPIKHRWDMPPDDGLGDDGPQEGGQQGGGQEGGRSRRGGSQGQPQIVYRNNNDAYTHSTVIKMLQADLARAESFTIRQAPDQFTLDYGSAVRSFTPGVVSVVSAAWGVADQSSGWKGREYVIHVKPQTGVASIESFSLADDGKHLVEELRLGGGEFPGVKLKRIYNRADHPVPRDVPTND
jgi:hypothetical protein